MHSLTITSPAKLNLVLRVLRKRKDGYHELCTLFHRISLADTLRLEKRREGMHLLCSHPQVPKKENLIVRAFRLLKRKHPFSGGVRVRLTKRIPVGGGLGGGSSNAAHFLIGMNRLFRMGLSQKELMKLGAELGADVPFFIAQTRHALGRGRGERIEPLPFPKRLWFLLFPRGKGLSTQRVYRGLRLTGPRVSLTRVTREVKMASSFLAQGVSHRAARFLVNDLAPSAERLDPSLRETQKALEDLQLGKGYMSGSGPTWFLIVPFHGEALQALRRLRTHRFSKKAILCHSL